MHVYAVKQQERDALRPEFQDTVGIPIGMLQEVFRPLHRISELFLTSRADHGAVHDHAALTSRLQEVPQQLLSRGRQGKDGYIVPLLEEEANRRAELSLRSVDLGDPLRFRQFTPRFVWIRRGSLGSA